MFKIAKLFFGGGLKQLTSSITGIIHAFKPDAENQAVRDQASANSADRNTPRNSCRQQIFLIP